MDGELFDRILADGDLGDEVRRRLAEREASRPVPEPAVALEGMPPPVAPPVRTTHGDSQGGGALHPDPVTEAIVLRFGRPTLLVRANTFEVPESDTWRARLYPFKARIDAALASVGRVEVVGVATPFVGTAWVVAPGVVVTNRHVASLFARGSGTDVSFRNAPDGRPYQVRVDFAEEHGLVRSAEVAVTRVLYIADDDEASPDLAFLQLDPAGAVPVPPQLHLAARPATVGQVVAAIGYPAQDPRNDAADQARLFQNIFDVKRLAPGEVRTTQDDAFTHDCTTLGGSSGSAMLAVETGEVVGLHFAGRYLQANYAVPAVTVRHHLGLAGISLPVPAPAVPAPRGSTEPPAVHPVGRSGFDEEFLGTGPLRVPLPTLSDELAAQVVVVDPDLPGSRRYALDYQHFSVLLNGQRRLAQLTAVNIDGDQVLRLKRGRDRWSLDPRVPAEAQAGEELYADNDLDRGHLVRRLDPAWGSQQDAKRGEEDTFFFPNCSPQHAQFNQRTWLELENYLLDNTDTRDFKACVMTGPVFSDTDPVYRGVPLPRAYWKVAVMVHDQRDALTATGYVVSQADLLTDLEFVFGAFRTYQVPLRRIETLTGLRLGTLLDADPLAGQEAVAAARELHGPDDIVL